MRRCAPPPPPPPSHSPPLLSDTAVLHALLRPHGGVDDHPPRAECKPTPPPVCSARTQHVRDTKAPLPSHADTNQDGRREVQFGAPLPSDDELLRTARAAGELYAANTSVVGARALGAPAAEWRAGDFAVRFDGCITAAAAARRDGRPRCDAAFARFANLSLRRAADAAAHPPTTALPAARATAPATCGQLARLKPVSRCMDHEHAKAACLGSYLVRVDGSSSLCTYNDESGKCGTAPPPGLRCPSPPAGRRRRVR
jgi:hypothetical protein